MAVDMLRSCYSTKMRFFSDHPEIESSVDWYFVDQTTPFLPFPTVFNSANWRNDKSLEPLLGEVTGASRPWRNGLPPGLYTGNHFCGTAQQFRDGIPAPVPIDRLTNGQPVCCGSPLPTAFHLGGLLYEGAGEVVDFPDPQGGLQWQGSAEVGGLPPGVLLAVMIVVSSVS